MISITLHWSAALIVIAMLGFGNAAATGGRNADSLLRYHTTIGILAYLLLAFRVFWRFKVGHPDALPLQNRSLVGVAKAVHYVMIGMIALMLFSGPMTGWAGGLPVRLLHWQIPSPFLPNGAIFRFGRQLHMIGAVSLLALITLHIGATLFHVIFKNDGTLDKMLVAPSDD